MSLCGHVNKHYYGLNGKLEDLTCTLEGGHTGDHSALHRRKVGTPVTDEKGRVISTTYEEVETLGAWNDAAGTPAANIIALDREQMTLYQRDLVLQIVQKNPKISIEDAVKLASGKEEWTQGVR